jgi:hypothetical protein
MSLATAFVILVLMGGGVSVAARSALPGDLFYPVKVRVNEEVRATLAMSEQAKAGVEAERAQERIKEAEELSIKTQVNAQTRADIEANFKAFADRAQARMKALASVDARAVADLASNFEVALRAHEKVLARLAAKDQESHQEVGGLQSEVDSELSDTVKIRVEAEANIKKEDHSPEIKAAAEGKIKAATNVIAEVRAKLTDANNKLTAQVIAKGQAQLDIAVALVAKANVKLQAGAYAEAFNLGNQAIRTAHEAQMLLSLEDELEVDLHLGGRTSDEPKASPHPTPQTEGMRESNTNEGAGVSGGARVDIEVGF